MSETGFRTLAPRLRLGVGVNADAIARAEAALKSLSANFESWMADELGKLAAARAAIEDKGVAGEEGEALYRRAHDLKGLGATYQYPIVTRMAGSLCRLIHDDARRTRAPMALIDDHIAAIRHAVERGARSEDDSWAAHTAAELEARTEKALAA